MPPILNLPPHPIPLGCPSASALSALFHALNLNWWPISHMVIYMFQCYSLTSSHSHLLPQSPKVCSIWFIFNWRKLFHNIVLASAIQQHKSAIDIHVSPPSHPFKLSQSPSLSSLSHIAKCIGYLFYIWQRICIHATLSNHLTLSLLPPPLSISLFSMSVSPLLP